MTAPKISLLRLRQLIQEEVERAELEEAVDQILDYLMKEGFF